MKHEKKSILERDDKIAIAVAILFFLTYSCLLVKSNEDMHDKYIKQEQIQKAQQNIKAQTVSFQKTK